MQKMKMKVRNKILIKQWQLSLLEVWKWSIKVFTIKVKLKSEENAKIRFSCILRSHFIHVASWILRRGSRAVANFIFWNFSYQITWTCNSTHTDSMLILFLIKKINKNKVFWNIVLLIICIYWFDPSF